MGKRLPTLEREIGGRTVQIPLDVGPGKDSSTLTLSISCGRCERLFLVSLPKEVKAPKYECPSCKQAQVLGPINW